MHDLETRIAPVVEECRIGAAVELDDLTLGGYAVVWDAWSGTLRGSGGEFRERIARDAFDLGEESNVYLLWMHDRSRPMASTASGTLTLTSDERGLKFSARLPQTSLARDAHELVRSGVIERMSFGFVVRSDSWEGRDRTVRAAELHELSLVDRPAYQQTRVGTSGQRFATARLALTRTRTNGYR